LSATKPILDCAALTGPGWVALALNPSYALDIVAHENKPRPNSLITGKITGNFLKFSLGCDIKIFSIYRLVPHLDPCIRAFDRK
jgi:hypothetical protein